MLARLSHSELVGEGERVDGAPIRQHIPGSGQRRQNRLSRPQWDTHSAQLSCRGKLLAAKRRPATLQKGSNGTLPFCAASLTFSLPHINLAQVRLHSPALLAVLGAGQHVGAT